MTRHHTCGIMTQGVLLFSDGNIAPIGATVHSYDLTTKVLKAIVNPSPEFADNPAHTPLEPNSISWFAFTPDQDLYYTAYYWQKNPAGDYTPLSAIFFAPHSKNNYPTTFDNLTNVGDTKDNTVYTTDDPNTYIGAIKLRQMSGSTGTHYRVYFSRVYGCRWAPPDPRFFAGDIWYVDDLGAPVLYYHVDPNRMPSLTCTSGGGNSDSDYSGGYWKGDFAFKDPGPISDNSTRTLLLSNGDFCGACIYQVANAGPSGTSKFGMPQRLFNPAATGIKSAGITGMVYVKSENAIYYASETVIGKVDLGSGSTPNVTSFLDVSVYGLQFPFYDISYAESWSQTPKSAPAPNIGGQKNVSNSYATQTIQISKIVPPNPEPNERIIAAQKWVEQTVKQDVSGFGLNETLSQWNYQTTKVGLFDQISGTVRDRLGYFHTYKVLVSQDAKVQTTHSTVI